MDIPRSRLAVALLTVVALGAVLAAGLALRLPDASNPVMPAEDPYTHMSLVREHLGDGRLESQNAEGTLYPPGMHALLAAWWVYSGAELYDLMRFGPVVFGLVAIFGVGILLWRWEGPLAAFVGALAMATLPEVVARTTMMSPTALDLALLPFLVFGLLEVLRGRLAWLAMAVPIAALLVVAHPWILAITAGAGLLFLLLYVLFPWRASRGPPVTREGAAAAVALLGGAFGVALATRWEASGTGFSELTLPLTGYSAGVLGALAVLCAVVVATVLMVLPHFTRARLPSINLRHRPGAWQVLGALLMAGLLLAIALPAVERGMPEFVDLPRMLGWPALALAAVGFILVPLVGGPAAHAAAALFLITFPFAVHNPLESPFWPHRTVVFMAFGASLLAGVAAQRVAEVPVWAALAARWRRGAAERPRSLADRPGATSLAAVVPALVVALAVGGLVLAETPEPYAGGWYRYYSACEFDALREVAALTDAQVGALAITGSWQAQLHISAFLTDADQVWFKKDFFTRHEDQTGLMRGRLNAGGPTFVVVDRWLPQETPRADLSFLQQAPWEPIRTECPGADASAPKVQVYQLSPG